MKVERNYRWKTHTQKCYRRNSDVQVLSLFGSQPQSPEGGTLKYTLLSDRHLTLCVSGRFGGPSWGT